MSESASIETRVTKLEASVEGFAASVSSFIEEQRRDNHEMRGILADVRKETSSRGRVSWPLVLSSIGALLAIVAPISAVIAIYVQGISAKHGGVEQTLRNDIEDIEDRFAEYRLEIDEELDSRESANRHRDETLTQTAQIALRNDAELKRIMATRWTADSDGLRNENVMLRLQHLKSEIDRIKPTPDE